MARGRFLNKSISLSMKFDVLPDDACRLMATWTIAHLDVNGVFYGDPAAVKSMIFPLRADMSLERIDFYLRSLETAGLIKLYTVSGRRWQWWMGFDHNQIGIRKIREHTDFPQPPAETAEESPKDDGGNVEDPKPDSRQDDANLPPESRPNYNVNVNVKLGANAPKITPTATPLQEISEATIAGTMQGDTAMPKKDVLEDTFERAMRAKMRPNETTIRAWNLPPQYEQVCIWFAEDAGVVVTKGDKGRWAKDAQQISELHPTRDHMRKATERAKSWRTKDGTSFTIASPHAVYDTIKQVMAEQAVPVRAEQQYENVMLPDGSMGRKVVGDA